MNIGEEKEHVRARPAEEDAVVPGQEDRPGPAEPSPGRREEAPAEEEREKVGAELLARDPSNDFYARLTE